MYWGRIWFQPPLQCIPALHYNGGWNQHFAFNMVYGGCCNCDTNCIPAPSWLNLAFWPEPNSRFGWLGAVEKKNCLFKSRENLFQFRLSWVHSCIGKEDIFPWPSLASYQGSLLLGRELTTSGTVETWKTGSKCWHYWQKEGASLMSSTEFTRSKISIQNEGTTPWNDILYIFCFSANHQMIYPG